MPNIFLVPAHPGNIRATIELPPNIKIIQQCLGQSKFDELSSKVPQGQFIYCWAFKRGKQNDELYRKMEEGDLVLFKPNGIDRITHEGTVCFKFRSAALANEIWPIKADTPWELVYFLCDVKSININFSTFKANLGFPPTYNPQGAIIIKAQRLLPIERQYGSFRKFLDRLAGAPTDTAPIIPPSSPNVIIRKAVSKDEPPPTDIVTPPLKTEMDKALHKGLVKLDDDIEALKLDRDHKERGHEALVQKLFELLGYSPHTEIKYQQGRIDICIEVDGKKKMVVEAKKDWSLTKEDKRTLHQAFNYSNEVGSRYVIITNGDYYAVYDRNNGFSYNDSFVGEFRISDFPKINYDILLKLKK